MRRLELVSVTGEVIPLDQAPYFASPNQVLSGMPTVDVRAEAALGIPGRKVMSTRHDSRDIPVSLAVLADSVGEFDAAIARLARAVDPVSGPVTIRFHRSDGTARDAVCSYVDGFDGVSLAWAGSMETEVSLIFEAHSPYWRSVVEYEFAFEQDAFDVATTPPLWVSPRPWNAPVPWNGAGAQGVAILPINVAGDVDSWPRFEIVGPGSAVEAINLRTQQTWRYAGALAAGQRLVVETEPGRRSVRLNDLPALKHLERGAQLWGLKRGRNDVAVRIIDYVPGQSLFKFTARDLWLTP